MKRLKRVFMPMLALAFMVCGMMFTTGVAYAEDSPLEKLESGIVSGKTDKLCENDVMEGDKYYVNYTTTDGGESKSYDKSGGGYYLYQEMFDETSSVTGWVNQAKFSELKQGDKSQFLKDVLHLGNMAVAYWHDRGQGSSQDEKSYYISSETLTAYTNKLQNLEGAGATLIESLMAETKPDFASANRIYQPMSGVVGTILGVISILMMALLGITMANDLAYIVIPMYQLFLDGDGEGGAGGQNGGKGIAKIVSQEARNAVKAAGNDGGSGGQQGSSNKLAVSVYFKHRWKSLVVLGLCLLYLVQGQIWGLVSWIINLVSGFVGF